MVVKDKIKILNTMIDDKERALRNDDGTKTVKITQELAVIKEYKVILMHSIGLKTEEEQEYEQNFLI